jgi:hypothetical protein
VQIHFQASANSDKKENPRRIPMFRRSISFFLRLTEPVIGSAEATIKSALKSRLRPRQRAWPAPRDAACVLNHAMAIMWT